MPQTNELPSFDPSWDYAAIYESTNDCTNALIHLLNFLARCEYSTAQSDTIAAATLISAIAKLMKIKETILGETNATN